MGHFSRRAISFFGRVAVVAVLFTQLVLVAYVCMLSTTTAAMAFPAGSAPDSCHEAHKNACLAQCLQPDQAVDSGHSATAGPPPSTAQLVVFLPETVAPVANGSALRLARNFEPPICIRMCRLLI